MSAPVVALIYPPTCDPTAPYLSVPMLTGFLRAHGVDVLPVDANVEAFDALLSPGALGKTRDRIDDRLRELDARASLDHAGQLELTALLGARGDAHAVVDGIDEAKATLRDGARFFDPEAYAAATATIDAALRAVSAAHHPLHLDFTAYRTPFGLSSPEEILRASKPDQNPFHDWVEHVLVPRIAASGAAVVGLSVCFPGQLQPAYAFAHAIKRALPDVHVTCGGPGITQMMIRLSGKRLARALGPFDSACLYEGERTLLALVRALENGDSLRTLSNVVVRDRLMGARWLAGHGMEDLRTVGRPDFDGMPLDRYFAPTLVLPYDPTRGCYWGKCTFCHYGLAEVGTAAYRERDLKAIVQDLRFLGERYGTRHFYFSQDSVAPKTVVKLAEAIAEAGLAIRWATDLKPEKYLTEERAKVLRAGGAVACALGVESGSPRVLRLIDKGAPIDVVSDVVDRLAAAGVAPEAMCFTDFPTETHGEAIATLDFLRAKRDRIAVYIVGEFGLTHGSLIAQAPERFGIDETWELEGDELGLGIFFSPVAPWKSDDERADVDRRLGALSSGWALRPYPWAGAVSTAHTVLHYDRFGPGVFRDSARTSVRERILGARPVDIELRYDPFEAADAMSEDAAIWWSLVYEDRRIGRDVYEVRANALAHLRPQRAPMRIVCQAGQSPERVSRPVKAKGRRPSHAHNAARR